MSDVEHVGEWIAGSGTVIAKCRLVLDERHTIASLRALSRSHGLDLNRASFEAVIRYSETDGREVARIVVTFDECPRCAARRELENR